MIILKFPSHVWERLPFKCHSLCFIFMNVSISEHPLQPWSFCILNWFCHSQKLAVASPIPTICILSGKIGCGSLLSIACEKYFIVKMLWVLLLKHTWKFYWYNDIPYSKVCRANMGPTWVPWAPDGPHVGPMNLAIRDISNSARNSACKGWNPICYSSSI